MSTDTSKAEGRPLGALPQDHHHRMMRVRHCLEGLSVGDGFGEQFFGLMESFQQRLTARLLPAGPWRITDDSIMALSIARCLDEYGEIQRAALATAFATAYRQDPFRGYGRTAHNILQAIGDGVPWEKASGLVFGGTGSCGNGGAMRAAPIGAYFADDFDRVASEAGASAEVTHAHPDGQTGAIAVALAAAWMTQNNGRPAGHEMIRFVLERIPKTDTYTVLQEALKIPFSAPALTAALELGSGARVIASDTVPYCLWCASKHAGDYVEAMWNTLSGFGDLDTTCAIVGGIVACSVLPGTIPEEWVLSREILPTP